MVNGRLQYKMVAGNERDGVRETWRDARSLHTRRPPAPEGGRAVASTDRIDNAVAPPKVSAEGRVNVTVTSNGTAAKTDATSEGMPRGARDADRYRRAVIQWLRRRSPIPQA